MTATKTSARRARRATSNPPTDRASGSPTADVGASAVPGRGLGQTGVPKPARTWARSSGERTSTSSGESGSSGASWSMFTGESTYFAVSPRIPPRQAARQASRRRARITTGCSSHSCSLRASSSLIASRGRRLFPQHDRRIEAVGFVRDTTERCEAQASKQLGPLVSNCCARHAHVVHKCGQRWVEPKEARAAGSRVSSPGERVCGSGVLRGVFPANSTF